MERAELRAALFDALLAASVPEAFEDDLRRSFLDDGKDFALSEVEMDSLASMEFCIALELSLGITLSTQRLHKLGSTDAIERFVAEKLA